MQRRSVRLIVLVIIQLMVFSTLASAAIKPDADRPQSPVKVSNKSMVVTVKGKIARVDFIHYAKGKSSKRSALSAPGYNLMGIKWTKSEPYVVNIDSAPPGLDSTDITDTIKKASKTWDSKTRRSLFGQVTEDNDAHYGCYDGKNAVEFASYDGSSTVISVTTVWYNVNTKNILEFDMLFNAAYEWSTSGADEAMDLQNIATHEFGHAVGLGDVFDPAFRNVTMYGYADYGETNKRSLANQDMTGLKKIYGK